MIGLSYLHIAAISVVPCTAVGASAYVGYQYYKKEFSPTANTNQEGNETLEEITTKQLQLEVLETELKKQESLLEAEESLQTKLQAELTFFEIEVINKNKAALDAANTDFVAADTDKSQHEASVQAKTLEKSNALSAKKAKQSLVDAQNTKIKQAEQQHSAQVKKEAAALETKNTSDTAATTAVTNHKNQEAAQAEKQKLLDENASTINTQDTLLKGKEQEKNTLTSKQTNQQEVVTKGLQACDEAIKDKVSTITTCEDSAALSSEVEEIKSALAAYTPLKEALAKTTSDLTSLVTKITEITNDINAAKGQIEALQNALAAEKTKTTKTLRLKTEAEQKQSQDNQAYEQAKTKTKELNKVHQDELAKLPNLTTELNQASTHFEKLEKELAELSKKTKEINEKHQQTKSALELLIGKFTDKDASLQLLTKKQGEFDLEIKAKKDSLDVSKITVTGIETKSITEITKLITEHKGALAINAPKIQSLKKQIVEITTGISSINAEITKATEAISPTDKTVA